MNLIDVMLQRIFPSKLPNYYKTHLSYTTSAKKLIKRILFNFHRRFSVDIIQTSPYQNIYYCCTQKTASQWFKLIFRDLTFYQYTGLLVYPYEQVGLRYARFNRTLPKQTIGTHFYFDYQTYLNIPKPSAYKTFFVLRDPRDIVVSFYFSLQYSHSLIIPIVADVRKELAERDLSDGLNYTIDKVAEFGLFEAQRSWMLASSSDRDIKIFRYEDMAQDNAAFLKQLFSYLDIAIPTVEFDALCKRYEFKQLTGRDPGQENQKSHYRKGLAGDWNHYFNESNLDRFNQVTGDLLTVLGY